MIRPKNPTPITRQRQTKKVKQIIIQEESEEEEDCFEFRPDALPDINVSLEEIDEFLTQYPV